MQVTEGKKRNRKVRTVSEKTLPLRAASRTRLAVKVQSGGRRSGSWRLHIFGASKVGRYYLLAGKLTLGENGKENDISGYLHCTLHRKQYDDVVDGWEFADCVEDSKKGPGRRLFSLRRKLTNTKGRNSEKLHPNQWRSPKIRHSP
ncbi:hypothetical protein GHT06_017704 [Daphnia sinensis]|uniref:Uncharacterized protein n=1 Tax=Daphnia sinensis TaxID=1820382 RepID=A0AAD5KM62_9CRUS|nr:hypothetical protein GHT06_017704 [Daphnia sinensis]